MEYLSLTSLASPGWSVLNLATTKMKVCNSFGAFDKGGSPAVASK